MDDKQRNKAPPSSLAHNPDHDSNMAVDDLEKPKLDHSEYLENGVSPETLEFQKKEKKLVRKLDLFIAPVMMMLMLISYLDRGNIGFASTQGMADEIGLVSNQLNVCLPLSTLPLVAFKLTDSIRPLSRSSTSRTFWQRYAIVLAVIWRMD